MPIKLIEPRPGKTPYFAGRGKHLGVLVNERSTKASNRADAKKIIRQWERDIERGVFAQRGEPTRPTFASAALAYMQAGGERRYVADLLHHFKETPLDDIDQAAIDNAAATLMPDAAAPTRNRQIYTPIAAVMHHGGSTMRVKRPKKWRGSRSTSWLEPDQAFALFAAGDALDKEFGLLLRVLLYTGMRISEALGVQLKDLRLDQKTIYLPETKNGHARAVHLPQVLVVALANQPPRPVRESGRSQDHAGVDFMKRPPASRLFRFNRSGYLTGLLKAAMKACGLAFPPRQGGFHLFCHTYGTWMKRYGNLDTYGLVRTDRWRDPQSADRYNHTAASEEARRSDLMPVPPTKRRQPGK